MEMELNYYYLCNREVEHKIDHTISRTMFPHLKIKFNIWSHFQDLNDEYSEQDDDAISTVTEDYSGSAYVTSGDIKSLSYEDVGEAAGKAISDVHYNKYDRESIIELMAREVRDMMIKFSGAGELNLKHTVCSVDLEIGMKRRWRHHVVDRHEMERLRGCCCMICLEEFGSDVREGMRMPCSHVFHDGCIKEWRRTSTSDSEGYSKEWNCEVEAGAGIKQRRRTSLYYCPICRCELPLDTFRY